MPDFHRTFVNDRSFIRGAARILVAPKTQTRPTKIEDVIALAAAAGPPAVALYDAKTGWTDLGATKTGIQITVNNAEETFDVDQQLGDISSEPTNWECSVGTQLAEMTPERLQVAWEGSAITVDATTTPNEQEVGFGQPTSYTERRLAVLFQRPNGKIRAYLFHRVQRMPQESSVTHAKTGEQISIPVRFRVLADTSLTDVQKRFFIIRDQDIPTP
jgi:hypothetical protein